MFYGCIYCKFTTESNQENYKHYQSILHKTNKKIYETQKKEVICLI